MSTFDKTSLDVNSNLYVIKSNDLPAYDNKFLEVLREPDAIREIKNIAPWYNFSDIQNKIIRDAAGCAYGNQNDFPYGFIFDKSSNEIEICKCIKTDCECFKDCRPDFNPDELHVLDENKKKFVYFKDILPSAPVEDNSESVTIDILPEDDIISEIDIQDNQESFFSFPEPEVINSKKSEFESFMPTDQEYLINKAANQRIIVNAGPGTGKTWSLIEKMIYMTNYLEIKPQYILVLCFSRAAVTVIQGRLKKAFDDGKMQNVSWREIEVRTFDSFSTSMILWAMDEKIRKKYPDLLPKGYNIDSKDYDSRIKTAESLLKNKDDLLSQYKHIFVDEVQDLVGCRADLVLQLLNNLDKDCGFTVLGDSCQAIYDYLAYNDNTITTSVMFYKSLFTNFPDAEKISFIKNYRQRENTALEKLVFPYREAILNKEIIPNNNFDELEKTKSNVIKNINKVLNKKLYCLSEYDLNEITNKGTLGILTRTNGIALQISTWFQNKNIPHNLQRNVNSGYFNRWIADFFINYENENITEETFTAEAKQYLVKTGIDIKECWSALTEKVQGNGRFFSVEEILNKILLNISKNSFLYAGYGNSADITISTIHRAKGREFDSVLLVETEGSDFDNNNQDDLLEHKIYYVALTRPKKILMKHLMEEKHKYIYIDRLDTQRCSKASPAMYRKKKGLSHIEIGCPDDIDTYSFAENEFTQKYISDELKQFDRLILKRIENTANYNIFPEEYQIRKIGETGIVFSAGITRAQRRMWHDNWHWYPYDINEELLYYPDRFNEIYVEDIVTCIARGKRRNIKSFGDISIWYGFSVHGFAQKDNNKF